MTAAAPTPARFRRRTIAACAAGSGLGWFDFFLYGTAAALVFGPVFFPGSEPAVGAVLAFATYGLGFLAHPIGAVLFGYFGDRTGRQTVLPVALLAMGMSTFLIGILPSHAAIGIAAPVLLSLLRFVQGLSLGGAWGGAVLLSIEHERQGRWGRTASWIQFGLPAGNIAAIGLLALTRIILGDTDFENWGWRLPFLLSAALPLVGLWIRRHVRESTLFTGLQERPANPLAEVLRTHRRALAASFLIRIGTDVSFYVFALYVLTYATEEAGLPGWVGPTAVAAGSAVQLALMPWIGLGSDRWGRKGIALIGVLAAAIWAWCFFPLVDSGSAALAITAVTVALAAHAAMYGPQAALVAELFQTRVRYSGTSLGYQLAGIAGGAPAPIVAIVLFGYFGQTEAIAVYVCAALAVSAAGLALAPPPAADGRSSGRAEPVGRPAGISAG